MSARSYLSIGDVLTLLRQEFPDVTISKIRFLESQGLVNPERTPSGYRKFYEHDVERLRWVLRQQREHFLPLKVIKDRLDDNGTVASPIASGSDAGDVTASDVDTARGPEQHPAVTAGEEPVLVGQRAPSGAGTISAAGGSHPGEPAAAAPTRGEASQAPAPPATTTGAPDVPAPVGSDPLSATADAGANGSGNGSGHRARATRTGTPVGGRAARSSKGTKAPVPTDGSEELPAVSSATATGGATLSMDELTTASGLTDDHVRQLEEYGLLSATVIAGAPFYDDESLTVATVAAQFAAYGIEARHLRLYRNAADREAGFVEQVVIPMVRQRNPEARVRASQTAEELAALGQQLRGSLLRSALRQLLNG